MAKDGSDAQIAEIRALRERKDSTSLASCLDAGEPKRVRLAALEALAAIGDGPALKALGGALQEQDEESSLAEEALRLLIKLPGDEALLALGRGLSVPDVFMRSRVVRAIASRPEPSVLTFLVRAARDSVDGVANIGKRQLSRRIKHRPKELKKLRPEALAGVMDVLSFEDVEQFLTAETDPAIREAAITRLGDCDEPEAISFLVSTCLFGDGPAAGAALAAIERNSNVPARELEGILERGSEELYDRAFVVFARRCGPESRHALVEALESEEPEVRREAAKGLFRVAGEEAVPQIGELLGDDDQSVCMAVLDCLQKCSGQDIEKPLVLASIMGAPEVKKRALALVAAKEIVSTGLTESHVEFLKEALEDPRPTGKALDDICDTIQLLTNTNPPSAVDHLVKAALSASPRMRRTAVEAIKGNPDIQRIQAYMGLADSPDFKVLAAVGFDLAEIGSPQAVVPLIRVLAGTKGPDADKAKKYLDDMPELNEIHELFALMRSRHAAVKKYAAQRLSDLGDPRAVEILLKAADDESTEVQLAAVEALGNFTEEEKVAKRLIDFLGYGDVAVRQKAVEILGDAKVTSAIDALISALGSVFLRSYAEEALRKIGDRRGYLAVLRRKKREQAFPNKAKLEKEKLKKARDRRGKKLR